MKIRTLAALTAAWVSRCIADDCASMCPMPLGSGDVVSATQHQLCVEACEGGHPIAVDSYAAVAISGTTMRAGVAYGEPSRAQAEKNSIASCQLNNGGADCKTVNWVANSCIGIAVSRQDKAYGVSGPEKSRLGAWTSALDLCRGEGGQHCSVIATLCSSDDPRAPPVLPLPPARADAQVDSRIVGTWFIDMNPGRWTWEIGSGGTYQFHSQGPRTLPTHAGLIKAMNGTWTLNATAGFADTDGGTYQFLGPDKVTMTGKLGTAVWRREH